MTGSSPPTGYGRGLSTNFSPSSVSYKNTYRLSMSLILAKSSYSILICLGIAINIVEFLEKLPPRAFMPNPGLIGVDADLKDCSWKLSITVLSTDPLTSKLLEFICVLVLLFWFWPF